MDFNTIIVAGGRSSRLGGTPKALLSNGSLTLLESTLKAVEAATTVVVVGPKDLPVPARVYLTRETPAYGGPAAALAVGARVLQTCQESASWTLVLSVDMPFVAQALPAFLDAATGAGEALGFMGETDGVLQPLAGIYRTAEFIDAFHGNLQNKSVRSALRVLSPRLLSLPSGSTADVDTWEQAHSTGFKYFTAQVFPGSK